MAQKKRFCKIVLFIIVTSTTLFAQTILYQDFESGIGNWYANNGLWEAGIPTVGPDSGYLSSNCVGTLLNSNYPPYADTRLISPSIPLPGIENDEKIQLKFWHWFRTQEYQTNYPYSYNPDKCIVQISVNSGAWKPLLDYCSGVSPIWTQVVLDISAYADSTIRLGFYFYSTANNEDNGWYIDDIAIVKSIVDFNNPEDFEIGVGDWSADNGLWEVGIPAIGPTGPHSGSNVVGVNLNGNYPSYTNTRLISPPTQLPNILNNEIIQLKFWHWFRTQEYQTNYPYSYNPDKCIVQISVNSGAWKPLLDYCSGVSPIWTQVVLDISAYADSTIRLGFYFYSTANNEDNGWYIDDIAIVKSGISFNDPEDFENGVGDWGTDNGLWEVGIPVVGPDTTHSIQNCAAINLNGNYPSYANTRLISPKITLTPKPGELPELFFWHWFRMKEYQTNYPYSYNPDYGYIQIKTENSDWQTLENPYTGISASWTQAHADLSAYADSTVRIGFYFTSTANNEDNGWYIDDIRIEGAIITGVDENKNKIPNEYILSQNYPNPFNPTTNIEFRIAEFGFVNLKVYDVLGNEIATLFNDEKPAGSYEIKFDGSFLPSGIYFYQLRAGNFVETKKMILLK